MPAALQAQSAGARSLSFALTGDGGSTFGIWTMRSERMNAGWEIGFNGTRNLGASETTTGEEATQSNWGVSLSAGPRFRRYLETGGNVLPFVQNGVTVGVGYERVRRDGPDPDTDDVISTVSRGSMTGALGVGLEWFPTARVSIAGYTGLNAGITYARSNRPGVTDTAWTVRTGAYSTNLRFRIYLSPTQEPATTAAVP